MAEKICAICNVPQSQHSNNVGHGFVAQAPVVPDEQFGTLSAEGLKEVLRDPTGTTRVSDVQGPSPTETLAGAINNLADAIRSASGSHATETPQPVTDV
jgi:hypothetical protein